MEKKIVVPCLDVIMIAFSREIYSERPYQCLPNVHNININSIFTRCLESVSDFFSLLVVGCTRSLSMGTFLLRVTISRS